MKYGMLWGGFYVSVRPSLTQIVNRIFRQISVGNFIINDGKFDREYLKMTSPV